MRNTAQLLANAEARMHYRLLGLIPEVEDDCPDPACIGYMCSFCNPDRTRGEELPDELPAPDWNGEN